MNSPSKLRLKIAFQQVITDFVTDVIFDWQNWKKKLKKWYAIDRQVYTQCRFGFLEYWSVELPLRVALFSKWKDIFFVDQYGPLNSGHLIQNMLPTTEFEGKKLLIKLIMLYYRSILSHLAKVLYIYTFLYVHVYESICV